MTATHRCLSEEQLLALVGGRCDRETAATLLAEVERCPECELVLAEAGRVAADVEGDALEPSPLAQSQDAFDVEDRVAGRYRIERVVGRGGMGEVYEAVDTELGERLALKTIRPHLADRDSNVERFKREIRLARRVVHPNVCRVLEFGRHEEEGARPSYFLTMELLDGELLSNRLRRDGPFGVEETLDLAIQLTTGLQAIHAEGVLHRDIKTNNVMLCSKDSASGAPRQRAVLLDFGVARSIDSGQSSLAAGGGLVGTPDYMAPEQLQGGPLSPATDVYAVGLIMFELLTGRLPSQDESSLVRAVHRLQAPPPAPSQFVPRLPRAVDQLVTWCLAPEAADRPPTATALLDALVALRDGTWKGPVGPRATVGVAPAPRRGGSRGITVLVGVVLVAALGLVLGFVLPGRSRIVKAPAATTAPSESAPRSTTAPPGAAPRPEGLFGSTPPSVPEGDPASRLEAAPVPEGDPASRIEPAPAAKERPRPRPLKRAAAVSCSPPYYYDRDGIQVFRRECL